MARHTLTLSQVAGLGRQYIATLELNPDAKGPVVVWAHGAGAGLGFGYRNYDGLANLGGVRRRVLAFDWLGQANSSRPPYPRVEWGGPSDEHCAAAMDFFLRSLEAWRAALGIEIMDLFAHSTGALVCAQYSLAHPTRVRQLVLHGAAGIGAQPRPAPADGSDARHSVMFRAALLMWDWGLLNFAAIQTLGRLAKEPGRKRFHRFLRSRRSSVVDDEELDLLFDYFWTALCSQRASSDRRPHGEEGGEPSGNPPRTVWQALVWPGLRGWVCGGPGMTSARPSRDRWVNSFLIFKGGLSAEGVEHFGLYGRRPLAAEAADRLATLPPTLLLYGDRDWVRIIVVVVSVVGRRVQHKWKS